MKKSAWPFFAASIAFAIVAFTTNNIAPFLTIGLALIVVGMMITRNRTK
ncbi:hypothetical protein ACFLWR_04835 [Chloroflexota bacterium]